MITLRGLVAILVTVICLGNATLARASEKAIPKLAAPGFFSKVEPINGAIGQSTDTLTLVIDSSSGALTYEYCIDTIDNDLCDSLWISIDFDPIHNLNGSTVYYWQMRAINADGTTYANNGEWWSFTTVPPTPFLGLTLQLDGVNDYASASDNNTLDLGTGATDDFTIESFFYVPNLANTTTDTLVWKNGAYGLYILYYTSQPDRFIFRINTDPANYVYLYHNMDLSTGWHHVAAIFDNEYTDSQDLMALYVDGNRVAFSTAVEWTPGIMDTSSALNVGGYSGINPVDGWMEETRLSNTVRYGGTAFTVPTTQFENDSNTRALWHFNDGWDTTIFADSSVNGNTLTGLNGAKVGNPPNVQPESAQAGPTFTVNTVEDVNDGTCGVLHCAFREAINASNSALGQNTILFDDALGTATIQLSSYWLGNTMLTDSSGTTMDGGGDITIGAVAHYGAPILSVSTAAQATIQNLTIRDGWANLGGGIHNEGNLTIDTVTLANNISFPTGGGVHNTGTLTVLNSAFSNNRVIDTDSKGGAIYNTGTLLITNSIFSNNGDITDPNGYYTDRGGAIYNEGQMSITGGSFNGNDTYEEGGAIFNTGEMTLSDSTFTGNYARQGGGIFNQGAISSSIENTTFSTNSASWGGGGVFNGGTLTISTNAIFSGNTVTGHGGGGIYNTSILTIDTITLTANSASSGGNGGGIANYGGTVNIHNSVLSSNTTSGYGGGIYNAGTVTASDITLSQNSASQGGGISGDFAGSLNIANSTFSENLGNGGGIFLWNGATAEITNTTFSGHPQGAINNSRGASLTVNGSAFFNNGGSDVVGAGINIQNGENIISNSTFYNNTAHVGGGIAITGGTSATVINSTFSGNSAILQGASIWAGWPLTLKNTIIANSVAGENCYTAQGSGGSITNGGHNLDSGTTCGFGTTNDSISNTDPKLGPLQDNGGPTLSMGLLPLSPAIDAGDNAVCASTPINNLDQRGNPRPVDGDKNGNAICDIGAYESPAWSQPGIFTKTSPANAALNQPVALTISWAASVDATSYEYCIDNLNNSSCDGSWNSSGSNRSVNLNNLNPNNIYYWQVRATNASGSTYANSGMWWSFTVTPLPEDFGKSTPANGTIDQPLNPMISWNQSIGAAGYEYCYDKSNDANCDGTWLSTEMNTSVALSGLNTNTIYYWQVRANNSSGTIHANNGNWWSFTTVPNAPMTFNKSVPANGATDQSTAPTLSWDASIGTVSYEYCYDTSNNSACNSLWISTETNTSIVLNGLYPSITYYWQVRANNTGGTTYADDGIWWSLTTIPYAPSVFYKSFPYNGAIDQSTTPTLIWEASFGAASYDVCYDIIDNALCDSTWIPVGAGTSTNLSDLTTNTTYYWQVRAINTGGTTYANANDVVWWSFTTIPNAPAVFNKSAPVDGIIDQALNPTLSWAASAGAASYEYCYDTMSNNTCEGSWISTGTNTSASLSGLNTLVTYYWQVRAVNTGGTTYSNSGAWWSFTTIPDVPAMFNKSAPANSASNQLVNPTLSWNTSVGAASYEYCYDTSDNAACDEAWISSGTDTFASLAGLAYNTTYYWQIRAVNPGGTTLADNDTWWSFTTLNSISTFADVPSNYWARQYIERLYSAGITGGCSSNPLMYCPTTPVTRAQMAIFLLRGIYGSSHTPPPATGTRFSDVPLGTFGAAWIEQLAAEGITSGCGGGNYCPMQPVSRAQMAIFLVRAKHGSTFVPPPAIGIFPDVPSGSFGANYIEQLVADAITSGCGGGNFCPNTTVKRDQMAVFLVKTFNLP